MNFYNGWGLTDQGREMVLSAHPPVYEDVRCDHVTLDLCKEETPAPDTATIRAYGYLEFDGYQILAVAVDGQLYQPRRDRMFHVTISHLMGEPSSHAGLILMQQKRTVKHLKQPFILPVVPFVRMLGQKPR